MRPGAGYLPTLALGRLRGPSTDERRMTLLHRRPRQVYRVYTEDEFLGMDDLLEAVDFDLAPASLDELDEAPAGRSKPRRRLRQVVGIAIPAAVAMTVSAIVVHDLRSETTESRRRGLRTLAGRRLASSLPPRWAMHESPGGLRPPRRSAEQRGAHTATPKARSVAHRTVAIAIPMGAPAVVGGGGHSQAQPTQALSASTAAEVPTHAAAARRSHPEFGFER
jgi:hypothetical protein